MLGEVEGRHRSVSRKKPVAAPSDRSFGYTFAVFFLCVSVLRGLANGVGTVALALLCAAAAFAIVAFLRPGLLHPLNLAWARFGAVMHRITTPLVLGVIFFLVFTPFGLVMRLIRRGSGMRAMDRSAASYWFRRDPAGPDPATMPNQF